MKVVMPNIVNIELKEEGFIWFGSEGFCGLINLKQIVTVETDGNPRRVLITLSTGRVLELPSDNPLKTLDEIEKAIESSEWLRECTRREVLESFSINHGKINSSSR